MSGVIDSMSGSSCQEPRDAVSEDVVISVRHVGTVLGGVRIHKDISLDVKAGEVLGIIGGSGSGKTTLLRLMLGLERPSEGEVLVLGHRLGNCEATDLAQVRHRWGVLFQQGALFSALTVFDNIALPLRELKSLPKDLIAELVMQKLVQVGLKPEDGVKMPSELSGGMIKRVSLARALIMDPQLLFLDEPTAGLDPASSKRFVQLIESLKREMALTVVMVTHDVDTLFALVDRIAVLADQQLVAHGGLEQVVQMQHPFIRNFFLGHVQRCAEESLRSYRDALHHQDDPQPA
ncbi:ABC transporter ATP-binding protein [Roseateles terrae]|uniref:Phospholipid/cholesterol/gamma-HCH transport system ATP-binding protein n=1 Tax=Roseateles terrae TaxID=431060 RepID=A0ABR6GWE2_9BURK|nr:ATP-binding cassette domain-containing protein [Roseateles terrae]MBB3196436.1 phospholipid/cholesterol/gamma-HCH transport system ATP-binding protein [Roseateles terrae]